MSSRTLNIFLRNDTSGELDSHTCEVGAADNAVAEAIIAWLEDVQPLLVNGDSIVISVTE